eukprot:TRINITY_DN1836_c0_g4_i2.p1 TRINITY_DN1836_c0_g4~~TRINITY_DN1836_c0_g4_i2.p1  ORF type:complete len:788 (-),score=168.91 TRINITY_DN1836_c0_g4_i2:106-2469(-)
MWEGEDSFEKELKGLTNFRPPISASRINAIAKLALKNIKYHKNVVHSVERFIKKCRPEYRLASLYIIDSICRHSRTKFGDKDVYVRRFSKNLEKSFDYIFQCVKSDQDSVRRVISLWSKNSVFPNEIIATLVDMSRQKTGVEPPDIPSHIRRAPEFDHGLPSSSFTSPTKKASSPTPPPIFHDSPPPSSHLPPLPSPSVASTYAQSLSIAPSQPIAPSQSMPPSQSIPPSQPQTYPTDPTLLANYNYSFPYYNYAVPSYTDKSRDPRLSSAQENSPNNSPYMGPGTGSSGTTGNLGGVSGNYPPTSAPPGQPAAAQSVADLYMFDYGDDEDDETRIAEQKRRRLEEERKVHEDRGGVRRLPAFEDQQSEGGQRLGTGGISLGFPANYEQLDGILPGNQGMYAQQFAQQTGSGTLENTGNTINNMPQQGTTQNQHITSNISSNPLVSFHNTFNNGGRGGFQQTQGAGGAQGARMGSPGASGMSPAASFQSPSAAGAAGSTGFPVAGQPLPPGFTKVKSTTLWLGNLPENTTKLNLYHEFSRFGQLSQIKLFPQKNMGFVAYFLRTSAETAKRERVSIAGYPIKIGWGRGDDHQGAKDSFNRIMGETVLPISSVPDHHTLNQQLLQQQYELEEELGIPHSNGNSSMMGIPSVDELGGLNSSPAPFGIQQPQQPSSGNMDPRALAENFLANSLFKMMEGGEGFGEMAGNAGGGWFPQGVDEERGHDRDRARDRDRDRDRDDRGRKRERHFTERKEDRGGRDDRRSSLGKRKFEEDDRKGGHSSNRRRTGR